MKASAFEVGDKVAVRIQKKYRPAYVLRKPNALHRKVQLAYLASVSTGENVWEPITLRPQDLLQHWEPFQAAARHRKEREAAALHELQTRLQDEFGLRTATREGMLAFSLDNVKSLLALLEKCQR